jgi:hypothetical protein
MVIHKHWVDLSRVDRIKTSPISHQLKNQPPANLEAVKSANAERGNRLLNLAAERVAKLATEML